MWRKPFRIIHNPFRRARSCLPTLASLRLLCQHYCTSFQAQKDFHYLKLWATSFWQFWIACHIHPSHLQSNSSASTSEFVCAFPLILRSFTTHSDRCDLQETFGFSQYISTFYKDSKSIYLGINVENNTFSSDLSSLDNTSTAHLWYFLINTLVQVGKWTDLTLISVFNVHRCKIKTNTEYRPIRHEWFIPCLCQITIGKTAHLPTFVLNLKIRDTTVKA